MSRRRRPPPPAPAAAARRPLPPPPTPTETPARRAARAPGAPGEAGGTARPAGRAAPAATPAARPGQTDCCAPASTAGVLRHLLATPAPDDINHVNPPPSCRQLHRLPIPRSPQAPPVQEGRVPGGWLQRRPLWPAALPPAQPHLRAAQGGGRVLAPGRACALLPALRVRHLLGGSRRWLGAGQPDGNNAL